MAGAGLPEDWKDWQAIFGRDLWRALKECRDLAPGGDVTAEMVERASLAYEVEVDGNVHSPDVPRIAMRGALEAARLASTGSAPAPSAERAIERDWFGDDDDIPPRPGQRWTRADFEYDPMRGKG
jgi:hypothetical protein